MQSKPRWTLTGELSNYLAPGSSRFVKAVNPGLVSDEIPESSTVPWIGTNKPWRASPGPLQKAANKFKGLVRQVRNDHSMWFENEFRKVLLPRNMRIGDAVQKRINDVYGPASVSDVPTPPGINQVKWTDFLDALADTGIQPRPYPWKDDDDFLREMWCTEPGNPQASLGVTSTMDGEWVFTGPKNRVWNIVKWESQNRWAQIPRDLTFENIDREGAYFLCKRFRIINQLALRVDGKPTKPRLIKIGDSVNYSYEQVVGGFISKHLKQNDLFAYHPRMVQKRIAKFREAKRLGIVNEFMNADYSGYDDSQCFELLKKIYRAVATFFDIPEWLMVYLFAVNAAAPIIRPDKATHTIDLQKVFGMARSGSGIFSVINTLLTYCINWWIAKKVYSFMIMCISFGDNHIVPLPPGVGAPDWQRLLSKHFGVKLKASESFCSDRTVVMLRYIYSLDDRDPLAGEPILFSRFRNALCPKDRVPGDMSPALLAIILRAQTLHIYHALQLNSKYQPIFQFWIDYVVGSSRKPIKGLKYVPFKPFEAYDEIHESRLMLTWSDAQLSRQVNKEGRRVPDTIDYTKTTLGIEDAGIAINSLIKERGST